jgi:hypothetical protein
MPLPGLPADAAPPADEKLWELRKGTRVAVCWRRRHPNGFQLRVDVNGDTLRTTVEPTQDGADEASRHMYASMLARGWQA